MKKRIQDVLSTFKNKMGNHPELDSGASSFLFSKENALLITTRKRKALNNNFSGLASFYQGGAVLITTKAFTLIELLVVVLIIGILAAIAVPQYEKAVWKSRAVQLQVMVKSLAQAQESYFMANGTYANDFASLDIGFDSLPQHPQTSSLGSSVKSTDAVRANDFMELVINTEENWYLSGGTFTDGPYKKTGFSLYIFPVLHSFPEDCIVKKIKLYLKEYFVKT